MSDLPSRELVPGDLVELKVGDRVPADVRMIVLKTATLRSEQASLTGESVAVLKGTEAVTDEECELQVHLNARAHLHEPVSMVPASCCARDTPARRPVSRSSRAARCILQSGACLPVPCMQVLAARAHMHRLPCALNPQP